MNANLAGHHVEQPTGGVPVQAGDHEVALLCKERAGSSCTSGRDLSAALDQWKRTAFHGPGLVRRRWWLGAAHGVQGLEARGP